MELVTILAAARVETVILLQEVVIQSVEAVLMGHKRVEELIVVPILKLVILNSVYQELTDLPVLSRGINVLIAVVMEIGNRRVMPQEQVATPFSLILTIGAVPTPLVRVGCVFLLPDLAEG